MRYHSTPPGIDDPLPQSGSNNGYAGSCDITCGTISWHVEGNSQLTYDSKPAWGLGGKKIDGVDRAIYSNTAIADNIKEIVITHGDNNGLTVNSMTVTVHNNSSDASTGSNAIATFTPSFVAENDVTITKTDNTSWAGKYYRIVYNLTYTPNSNKRIIFAGAVFYKTTYTLSYTASSAGGTITVTDGEDNEVASGTALEPGTVLNIAAEANSGYSFNGWSVTGNSTIGNASSTSTTLTLGTANETLSANFVSAGSYISVAPSTANIACAGDVPEFNMTTNISTPSYSVAYYTSSTGDETTTKPSWFGDVEFSGNTLDIEVNPNTGAARSAYFKVYSETTYSDVVTINQAVYAPSAPTLPATGNFDYTKEITITVPDGTTVYYTLDGSNPTSSSTAYSAPFTINATKTVKAITYEGIYPSAIAEATYTRTYNYISDITSANNYTVKGTVVAVNGTSAFVLGDGTGYVYFYGSHSKSVGDLAIITDGHVKTYNHVFEFENGTLSVAASSTYTTGTPAITSWTESIFNSYSGSGVNNLSTYVQVVGTYTHSTKEISIAGTTKIVKLSTNTDYSSLNGKIVKVKGYFAGFNSSGTTPTTMYICPESVEAVPVLTTSVTSISNFTYNVGGGPDAKSFTVSGANLTDDITVSTNSANFEISSDNSNWQTSDITISKGSGTVAATTIYVRLKSGLDSNTYNGKITVSSDGADDKEITLTGTVKHTIAISGSITNGSVESDPSDAAVAGATVTLTADPAENYKLGSFTVTKAGSGTVTVTSAGANTGTFTMPSDNVTVSATFVPAYTVTYAANGGSGEMIDENSPYIEDAQVTLLENTFTYAGHTWSSWLVKDASQNTLTVTDGKFTMPASAVTVTAQWNVSQYTVALSEIGNVTLLASYGSGNTITEGNDADVDYGTEITLSATDLAAGKVFVWNVVDLLDNDVTEDVLNGDVLTVPDYDIIIGGQVAELFFKYSGDLTEGDYIIANGSYAMLNTLNSNRFNRQSISPSNNQIIVANASAYLWHIASSGDYWTIYNAAEEKYAVGTGTASQIDLGGNSDDKCLFSVSGTTTYTFENKYNKDQSVNAYLRDGGTYWACYASGTANTLYKKAVGSKHSVAIAAGITNGSVGANPSSAYEGQPVALTATPSDGYMIDSWDVYKTGDASTKITVKNNSFIMPGYDVTVSATFRVQHTYTLVDGSTVTLVPGKHYIIASTNSTNYYVMGAQNGSVRNSVPATLSESKILENNDFYEVVISGDNTNKWTMYSVKDEGYLYATGAGSANINVREDNVTTNPTYGQWSISVSSGTATITSVASLSYNKFTYNHNGGTNPRFACYSTAQTAVKLYVRDGDDDIVYYSPTSITVNNPDADSDPITVLNNEILTLTGDITCTDAANLVINDGGQLICNSSVPATFKKTMTNPSRDVYGWELISSPVHDGTGTTIAVANVTNLVSNADPSFKYDMFAYDEDDHMWRTQKNEGGATGFTTLNNGEGYMYRNSGNELSFVGNTNSDAVDVVRELTYTAGDLAGFQLVGNPYTHDITLEDDVTLLGEGDVALAAGKQLSGYYLLTNGGSEWTSELGKTTDIATKQGFLIQIPAEAKKIKFSNGAKKDRANADNIMFTVSNSQFKDVAYVLFADALGLNKINHRDADAPMLFINQNGQDYAIAAMSDDTKSFNLNFKAGTIGQYTLSYKADGKFEYLHVIDLLTGEDVDMLLEGEYSFIGHPKDNENRFIVRLAYASDNNDTSNDIFAYQSGNDIYVTGNGELQVFDVTGRQVMTTTINGMESISIPNQGVYIFRLNEKVQKIVVR